MALVFWMNIEDRKKIVRSRNVRHLYGGKYEPLVHLGMFLFIVAWFYLVYSESPTGKMNGPFSALFIFVTLPSCFSYFWVARVRKISNFNVEQFQKLKKELMCASSHVKSRGKYFVEYMMVGNVHITVFVYENCLYASAFKYGPRRPWWYYVPIFTGEHEVDNIQQQASQY